MNNEWYYKLSKLIKEIYGVLYEQKIVLREVGDFLPVGVALIDPAGKFEWVNERFCETYSYSKTELYQRDISLLFPENTQQLIKEFHTNILESCQRFDGIFEVRDRYRQLFTMLAVTACLTDHTQKSYRLIVETPMEDYCTAEENLRQALALLEADTGSMSLKLKGSRSAQYNFYENTIDPLGNIFNMTDFIRINPLSQKDRNAWLRLIFSSASNLQEKLSLMAAVHSLENAALEARYTYFNVIDLIQELEDKYRVWLGEKGLMLIIKLNGYHINDHSKCMLYADRKWIFVLITKLLVNALEASPEFNEIQLELFGESDEQRQESEFRLVIHNAGQVPEVVQPFFFDKYMTYGNKRGAGLGTYIMRAVVHMHQGRISMATSQAEGTHITVRLPNSQLPSISFTDKGLKRKYLEN